MENVTPAEILVSFDIDGTLDWGMMPGPVGLEVVRRCAASGIVFGSCSQNDINEQEQTWRAIGVRPDFLIGKDYLAVVRKNNPGLKRYIHVGDWLGLDDVIATRAGFEFVHAAHATAMLTNLLDDLHTCFE